MKRIIRLRIHHIETFIEALMSEKFREKIYLAIDKGHIGSSKNGFCHSKKESELARKLLNSVTDKTKVRIVLEPDNVCKICTQSKKTKKKLECSNPDSVWDNYDLLSSSEITSRLTITIGFLKKRYRIVKKYGSVENWRREKQLKRKRR